MAMASARAAHVVARLFSVVLFSVALFMGVPPSTHSDGPPQRAATLRCSLVHRSLAAIRAEFAAAFDRMSTRARRPKCLNFLRKNKRRSARSAFRSVRRRCRRRERRAGSLRIIHVELDRVRSPFEALAFVHLQLDEAVTDFILGP